MLTLIFIDTHLQSVKLQSLKTIMLPKSFTLLYYIVLLSAQPLHNKI